MRGHVIVGVMTISTDVDKLYDTDLTDAAWALIAPMLPAARPGGRPRKINIRAVLNAIFYLLRTGCQWRLLPREFPGVEHGLSLLPGLEERWCLDLYPALNVPASSTASRPGRLSLSRHYGRSVGKDHRTRRHSRIRCAQARERSQAPYFGGHPRAADRMQSGASRHLRPKGGCPVARWPEAIIPEHSHSHRCRTPKSQARAPPAVPGRLEAGDRQTPAARVQDHRPHLDCGAQLRLAWPKSTIEQGLRVLRAELRDTHRNRRNTPYAQSPRSGMSLFKHALSASSFMIDGERTLPVISATAPGVFAARRVRCRNTHFDFPVGVRDFAMLPGVFLSTPGSGEGFTSRRPDAAGELVFLEHGVIAKCVLIGAANYFTAGPKRSTSSFHEAMILAFVFRALRTLTRSALSELSIRSCTRRCASGTEVEW